MTLKDLFLKEKEYIIAIKINENYHLFVEGLDKNGCTNTCEEFNIANIKTFCIELIETKSQDYLTTLDSYGITLNENVENLVTKAIQYLGEDSDR